MVAKEGERIATLEATMQAIDKKVDAGFTAINKRLDDFAKQFENFYATSEQRWANKEELSHIVRDFENKIDELKKQSDEKSKEFLAIANKRTWIVGATGIILGGIVAQLIDFYFTH